jgi:hypothetical protein
MAPLYCDSQQILSAASRLDRGKLHETMEGLP